MQRAKQMYVMYVFYQKFLRRCNQNVYITGVLLTVTHSRREWAGLGASNLFNGFSISQSTSVLGSSHTRESLWLNKYHLWRTEKTRAASQHNLLIKQRKRRLQLRTGYPNWITPEWKNYVDGVNKRTHWYHSPDSHTVCCLWCNGSKMFFSELERLLVIKRTSFDYNSLCCNLVDQVNCFQDSMPPFHCTSGRKMRMHLNV